MYIYDQGRASSVSLGIGRLGGFGKSSKKTEPDPAEATRLEGEIRRLRDKAIHLSGMEGKDPTKVWEGVNSRYEEWLKVCDKTDHAKWPFHQMAAEAAMKRGDAISGYKRITIALSLLKHADGPAGDRAQLEVNRKDLEENWARVDIRLRRKLQDDIIYPIPPSRIGRGDFRAAFKWASEKLREGRKFNGLLPLSATWGRFSIDGQEMSLEPDCALLLASVVRMVQKGDGTFKIDRIPRPATAEINPPTLID